MSSLVGKIKRSTLALNSEKSELSDKLLHGGWVISALIPARRDQFWLEVRMRKDLLGDYQHDSGLGTFYCQ